MFSKAEIKTGLMRIAEKWFFPDFTNKLTWYVVTLGASFILIPQPVKLFFINWIIDVFNLNSGLPLTLPEIESSSDYFVGIILIFFSLTHNLGYRYFSLRKEQFEHKARQEKRISDFKLYEEFINTFPSDSASCNLLREHDFGGSFNGESLEQIRRFYYKWDGAEYNFLDDEINNKKILFHELCDTFLSKIAEYTTTVGTSNYKSVIPDRLKGTYSERPDWIENQITELNQLAENLYNAHQEFISFAKLKLQR